MTNQRLIDNKWTRTKTIIKCALTKRLETNRLQDACHKLDSLTVESLWLMVKHRSAEIGRFEVQFPVGARNFYFVPRSWQDEKITLSIILPSAKLTISLILFRDISLFWCTQSSGWMPLIIWYKVIDVLWSSVFAWSSKHPIIAKQHRIDVFSGRCWSNRFQALFDRLCLHQERSLKLKVRRMLLTNHH